MTKLLVNECLSLELALMARERGHHEASHVVWIGKAGWKDWELKRLLPAEDWVLVTRNSDHFRGPRETLGSKGQYSNVLLHAGLICLNAAAGKDLALQRALLRGAGRTGHQRGPDQSNSGGDARKQRGWHPDRAVRYPAE